MDSNNTSETSSLRIICGPGIKQILVTAILAVGSLILIASLTIMVLFTDNRRPNDNTLNIYDDMNTSSSLEIFNVLDNINTDIDPCNNFYEFVCTDKSKQFVKKTYRTAYEEQKSNYLKLYNEPIKSNDPNIVKIHKNLFQTCEDQKRIIHDFLPALKKIQTGLGGWPVVVGNKWNGDDFDWLKTVYKMRQLGYDYDIFIVLGTFSNIEDENKGILELKLTSDFIPMYNTTAIMAIAKMCGAKENFALRDIEEMLEFMVELQSKMQNKDMTYETTTISEYQTKVRDVNWLEFINAIGNFNPGEISLNATVTFPSADLMSEWLDLIAVIPKRVLANYMVWNVIETHTFPTARSALIHYGLQYVADSVDNTMEQPELCVSDLQYRFYPNPMEIVYTERYLSKERRHEIVKLSNTIKSVIKNIVLYTEWINAEDKINILKKIRDVTFVVGMPEEYANYTLFNEMKFDEVQLKSKNFFDVYARTKKHHTDWQFSWINKPLPTGLNWNGPTYYPKYLFTKNLIYMPDVFTRYPLFNTENPNYLGYTSMGYFLYEILSDVVQTTGLYSLSPETQENFVNKESCIKNNVKSLQNELQNIRPFELTLTQQVLNELYNNHIKENEEESWAATKYTPKQLFWISFYKYLCRYSEFKILDANPDLAKDFNCKNFEDKCEVFKV